MAAWRCLCRSEHAAMDRKESRRGKQEDGASRGMYGKYAHAFIQTELNSKSMCPRQLLLQCIKSAMCLSLQSHGDA